MQRWEYYVQCGHQGEEQRLEGDVNCLGADGWQSVAVVPALSGTSAFYWLNRSVS